MTDLERATRAFCARSGLTMSGLSKAVGVSRQTLYTLLARAHDEDVEAVAWALGVPLTYMLGLMPIEASRARLERAITGGSK